ncbi:Cell division protein FtsN [Thalassovita autumnalis]|uniref:Cell division protein FtsN n=1 Tax=Thalassovita autumnalis TaxID=2072972 RepID=A0A0P1FVN8_9RHOB|nr:SPOR domain-containing protein [Thalassovita autumnalis]CUH69538.1 Cell division protein FtsN [Thalassovita autumnalis]CUH72941.1 Cell division protein FtsN [Thalassovita autumnalis]
MAEMQDTGRMAAPAQQAYNTTAYDAQAQGHDVGYDDPAGYEAEAGYEETPASLKAGVATALHFTGAAVSLGLLIGVGVWGYQLVVRDVSGVPVVQAAEGPMRIAPVDPGGSRAENQGLAVNEVAADGGAQRAADRVILAPPPLDLDKSDPLLAVDRAVTPAATSEADGQSARIEALVGQVMREAQEIAEADQTALIQQASLTQEVEAEPATAPVEAEVAQVIKPIEGGMGRSLRPKARPANLQRSASLRPDAVSTGTVEVSPDTLTAGTRLAQLGAYDSPEVARKEWDKIAARFGDFMLDKQRVVQKAKSAGSTFYRLRVHGFASLDDARRFCNALDAEGTDCIPVTHK